MTMTRDPPETTVDEFVETHRKNLDALVGTDHPHADLAEELLDAVGPGGSSEPTTWREFTEKRAADLPDGFTGKVREDVAEGTAEARETWKETFGESSPFPQGRTDEADSGGLDPLMERASEGDEEALEKLALEKAGWTEADEDREAWVDAFKEAHPGARDAEAFLAFQLSQVNESLDAVRREIADDPVNPDEVFG